MANLLDALRFEVPPEQIAQEPLARRDRSRLMLLRRGRPGAAHHAFTDLPGLLPPRAVLVVNNTRVLPARLPLALPGGAASEALLVAEQAPGRWEAMVKGARRIRPGARLDFCGGHLPARAVERTAEGTWVLAFDDPPTFRERLLVHGLAPLPPYIRRPAAPGPAADRDREAYQTCFARVEGAVAAPTAGLHFTPEVMAACRARGCTVVELTLHVGPGTFRPIQVDDPALHQMHREWYELSEAAARRLLRAKAAGEPVIAVGTTSVRALEGWAAAGSPPGIAAWTDLFIQPPYDFRVVDGLVTNFHQPRSTLLLLVAALHGGERLMAAYREAVGAGYRFFSFGDCMAILPEAAPARP